MLFSMSYLVLVTSAAARKACCKCCLLNSACTMLSTKVIRRPHLQGAHDVCMLLLCTAEALMLLFFRVQQGFEVLFLKARHRLSMLLLQTPHLILQPPGLCLTVAQILPVSTDTNVSQPINIVSECHQTRVLSLIHPNHC